MHYNTAHCFFKLVHLTGSEHRNILLACRVNVQFTYVMHVNVFRRDLMAFTNSLIKMLTEKLYR